jgi:hypothetical protein
MYVCMYLRGGPRYIRPLHCGLKGLLCFPFGIKKDRLGCNCSTGRRTRIAYANIIGELKKEDSYNAIINL